MKLSLATPEDDEALKTFYESFIIHNPIEIQVERPKSFFDYYKLQSDDFETHILKDNTGKVQGCATLVFREGQIMGQKTKIGYATDLRVAQTREAIMNWARYFLPITKSITEKRDVNYLFSVISGSDSTAYNTLLRPRAQRRNIPVYNLLRKFDLVSIVGHLPLLYQKLKTIELVRLDEKDLEPLAHYLQRKSSHRALAFPYNVDFLKTRLQKWPGLRPESFIIAKDRRGNIVGCVAPWSSNSVQRLYAKKYTGFTETTKKALKIGSWFNLSSPLPQVGNEFQIEFLTHLYADNADIFEFLLEESYRAKAPDATLVYAHFHNFPQTRPPKQFFFSRTPSALYTVSTMETALPRELLHSPLENPPELELCLI